ncbi:MAG: VWA domain-containing protein [Dehalococcoidia bacterium]|nr:VWA domain-containing protein [Dehalococcoidia bacterium]
MIDGLRFAEPLMLFALAAPLLIALGGWHAERRRREAAALTASPAALRMGSSHRRRVLHTTLVALATALLVLAAARPQWGRADAEVMQRGIDLVIVLDVSRSMLAEDIAPSRAGAAALGIEAMLTHLTGHRVGLVTFAGTAFERSPLTLDLDAVSSLVLRAQQEAPLVRPGTNLGVALNTALNALTVDEPAQAQAILLVTDGEEIEGDVRDAIKGARDKGVRVYTVFAATDTPTSLPATSGGQDVTTANRDTLRRIADETGGEIRDISSIPGLAVEFRRLRQTQFEAATEQQPIDRFSWFLGAAVALLAADLALGEASRLRRPRLRGGLVTSAFVALLLAGCAGTSLYRMVEDGNEAYLEGRYDDALAAYTAAAAEAPDDPAVQYNLGNTLHMLGRLREAATASRAALATTTEDADLRLRLEYALGNHAFMAGELEEARDRYVAALRLDPTDAVAKANLELLLWFLESPPPPEDEGEPEPGEDSPPGEQPGQQPQDGATPTPAEPPGEGTPPQTPGEQAPPGGQSPPGPSGEDGEGPSGRAETFEEAQAALAAALGELGPEVTREEALRILELARRANELAPLPTQPSGSVPAR